MFFYETKSLIVDDVHLFFHNGKGISKANARQGKVSINAVSTAQISNGNLKWLQVKQMLSYPRSEYLSLIHEQRIKRLNKLSIFTNQEFSHVRDQSLGFN